MCNRPNIVIVMTDQQRADLRRGCGYELDTMPFLDRWAEGGVDFARAYTPNPTCMPARVSMFTGRYSQSHRVRTNHNAEDALYTEDLLDVLKKAGYTTALFGKNHSHRKPEDFDRALLNALQESGADLVVLAGCLVVIPRIVVDAYPNRIINIHPSLIPSFCGTGYYGLKVHEAELERGVKVAGATVHFVDEGTDTGPIILQKAVEVKKGDTPEILQRRVMEEAEWKILPRAIQLIADGKVRVTGKIAEVIEED